MATSVNRPYRFNLPKIIKISSVEAGMERFENIHDLEARQIVLNYLKDHPPKTPNPCFARRQRTYVEDN